MGEGIRLVDRLQGAASVGRAFGEPVRQGDLVILPVASVRGGGGGGDGGGRSDGRGDGGGGRGEGGGAGFGLRVVPCGVFVIDGERIRWRPAVDVNRVVLGGQVVALAIVLTVRSLLHRRCRTGRFLR